MNTNVVVLQGNLTDAPTFHGEDNGVARFTIAVNTGFGENKEASFIPCVAFGKQVETIRQYFEKGKQIVVTGTLHQNRWQNDEGENRSRLEVRLNNYGGFSFVQGQRRDEGEAVVVGEDGERIF